MRPDLISPSFAEQTDTPKVVASRNEVRAQFIGLLLVIRVIGAYFWPIALTLATAPSLVYGSAEAAHYLLAGISSEIGCAAVVLSSADSNRHDEI